MLRNKHKTPFKSSKRKPPLCRIVKRMTNLFTLTRNQSWKALLKLTLSRKEKSQSMLRSQRVTLRTSLLS